MRYVFRMPSSVSITGRSSSITNAFIAAIIPVVYPTNGEILEALEILQIDPQYPVCAYCSDPYTEWDHLRPLVVQQRPTGYISEIANLVPACGKCNQSKGNKPWRSWILSDAPRSPKSRQVTGIEGKIARLEAYEEWRDVTPLDFEQIIRRDLWERHWRNWQRVLQEMRESQDLAIEIKAAVRAHRHT